jgi:hypothetical protein
MDNNEISVTQALNHVQSWLNAEEYDKVIQGCQEILEIEPGNPRALSLMKQAEERRHLANRAAASESPKEEVVTPENDPLAELQVEASDDTETQETSTEETETVLDRRKRHHRHDKRKNFLAMLIPAILVVLIGGAVIWALSNRDRQATIDELIDQNEEHDYQANNEERVSTLSDMAKIIESYKEENGAYPSAKQLESALLKTSNWDEIPYDPMHGEFDVNGQVFGYMYAVYNTEVGRNQYFLLSALFEDSKGNGYAWAYGDREYNFEDYRDVNADHVTFVGEDVDVEIVINPSDVEIEADEDGPKVKSE